ncbi:RNA polymerase sigma factor [Roseovarius sp. M141]|uniref:RNA polymerase sigma factor n=1 Tax=Roseovarius sp. M141 TaxID=2583806 RepID=UPI0020CC21D9|nr:RNA polymerase sigma factor [Roseovarius sp. M141]MCQ0092138.1 RNA polymerase sigma factor [Roseovarius sp. M141]
MFVLFTSAMSVTRDIDQETQIVALLATADPDAFETVYRRYNGSMLRLCGSIVKNHATAEEIAQDTWVAVLTNISKFEGRSSLAGWIYSILVNKSRTRLKRDGRSISFDEHGDDGGLQAAFDGKGRWKNLPELWDELTPERIVAGRAVVAHIADAIETLPTAQRAVLILRSQKDLDPIEVCEILDITEGNMRVLLHRARLAMRKTLDDLQRP